MLKASKILKIPLHPLTVVLLLASTFPHAAHNYELGLCSVCRSAQTLYCLPSGQARTLQNTQEGSIAQV